MSKRFFMIAVSVLGMLALLIPSSRGLAQVSPAPSVNTNATFNVIIAAALASNVDVYLDGAITHEAGAFSVKPLNYSGFIVTTSGVAHTITLFATGTTTPVISSTTVTFGALSDTSVVLLSNMTWTTIADQGVSPLPGQASVRAINLSSDASTTSVDVTLDGAAPATFVGAAYPPASSISYLVIPSGSHVVTIPGSLATAVTHNFQSVHVYSILVFCDPSKSLPKILVETEFNFDRHFYVPDVSK